MSTTSVGQIGLDLVVNRNKFNKQMTDIQSLAKKTGKILAGAFAVKGIVDFGKKSIELGSDLAEVQNVVDVTFTTMSDKVNAFAKDAAASFGLSETMAKKYTGTFGAMAKAFGFSEQQAYEMSTSLTGLAGDVASFYNLTQDEAYTKLKSVFTGETESLKDLGVVMTQTALDAFALENGFGKTTKSMNEAEKVALRYAFVQKQLTAASGDFQRTGDSWANQVKVLKLQMESFMSSVGQGFINLFTPAIQIVNNLVGKLLTLGNAFKGLTEVITGKTQSNMSTSISGITESATAAQGAVSGIGDAAEKAAKQAKGLSGIDELNNLSSSSSASAGTGTAGASINTGIVTDPTSGIDGNNVDGLAGKFKKLTDALDKFKESASKLAGTIKDGLGWCYDNILKPFGNWVMNEAAPKILELFGAALEAVNEILLALQPLWQWAWDNFLKPLAEYVGDKFIDFLEKMTDLLTDFSDWCSTHQTTVQNIAKIVGVFVAAFKTKKIVDFTVECGKLIIKLGLLTVELVKATAAKIVDKAETIYLCALYAKDFLISIAKTTANLIKQTAAFIASTAAKIANTVAQVAMTAATAIWNTICTIATAVTTAFSAAVAFLTSPIGLTIIAITALVAAVILLVKNFDKVKEVAKNVFNAILSAVESMVNGVIKGLNFMIKALNNLKFDVPDWVPLLGGKKFGFNIKTIKEVSIPKLAEGGFVKANTPQLAIIGDNRHQGEIVAPENKLEEMALKAAQKSGGNKNVDLSVVVMLLQKQNELLMAILEKEVGISEKDLFNSVRKSAETYTNRTGNPAFSY